MSDAADVIVPPAPGRSLIAPAPAGTLDAAAAALAASLRAAGLTDPEIAAFTESWNEALFGPGAMAGTTTTIAVTAAPMRLPTVTTSVIYVLPLSGADALAELRITPAPTALRRAIVVWLDETSGP